MLACIELRYLFGFYFDLAASLGVDAGPSLTGPHFPGTEPGDADLLALLESLCDRGNERIQHSCTLFFGEISFLGYLIDQFALVHSNSPPIPHE